MATVQQVRAALDRIKGLERLWPDFEPATSPLTVWDGVQTWLFQAGAAPGSDWQPASGGEGAWVLPYRWPPLIANSTATLESGSEVATLMLSTLPDDLTEPELAALIVHEGFHVYQSTHHPERWQADELAVFGSPLTAQVLATRRLETSALNRALQGGSNWAGHAVAALSWRGCRFVRLTEAQAELERGWERREGIAQYVERKVSGRWGPLPYHAAEALRIRCYDTGAALARLLDRTGDWMAGFLEGRLSLDELLAERLAGTDPEVTRSEQVVEAQAAAALEASEVDNKRAHEREAFLARPGLRLTIRATERLWPQGFDPMNVGDLGDGLALHRRYLRFGNARLSGEVLDREVLTLAPGPHPLLGGFTQLVLSGLTDLCLDRDEDTLHIQAQGVEIRVGSGWAREETSEGWIVTTR